MSMTDQKIAPALTREEWADAREGGTPKLPRYLMESDAPAVMALANHALPDGHGMKLTRADVEAARAMGDADMDAADSMDTSPRHATILWRLAEKLSAFLPPE